MKPGRSPRRLSFPALVLVAVALPAQDWPQWLGPERTGVAPALASLTGAEGVEFEPVWRRPLGSGYASLAVRGDRAITMASLEDGDYVLALDKGSGETLWRYRLGEVFLGRSGSDDGPASTPTVSQDSVFALEPSGQLVALDLATGELRWKRHLEADFGAVAHTYGYSTAPVWTGSDLIVAAGGSAAGSMLVSLDGATGELNWAAGTETVLHQTPAVATVAGVEQAIVPHNGGLQGFALDDGRALWSLDFEERSESGQAVVLDGDRILVSRWSATSLVRVEQTDSGLAAERVWTSRGLGNTYAVPVRHGEYLYGFNRRFLSCVELATGETAWKSRQPGGQALTLIGDTLWVVASTGELVVAAAAPEGYRELGRIETFDARRVYTPPTTADGVVFVRNLEEAAAWRPRSAAQPERPSVIAATGLVAELEDRLAATDDADALLLRFQSEHPEWPVVEDDEVHFLFRGDVADIAIVGDMTGGHAELPMQRLGDTNLYFRTFEAPEVFRWEYRYRVFDRSQVDRRNGTVVRSGGQPASVVERAAPAGESEGSATEAPAPAPQRKMILTRVDFPMGDDERPLAATLYLPEAPASDADGYPLLLWMDGRPAIDEGSLDELVTALPEPAIVAFLHLPGHYVWNDYRSTLATALSNSILPMLIDEHGASASASRRAVIAQEWGAGNVLHWALTKGEVGLVALQSPYFVEHEIERVFADLLEGSTLDLHIDWGESDDFNRDWGLDVAMLGQQLATLARERGHNVTTVTSPGGSNWTRWAAQAPAIIEGFLRR